MRILVTGGAGFIGSAVAHTLNQRGHNVTVVDDLTGGYLRNCDGLNLYQVDITDYPAITTVFDRVKPEVVVHCAAYAAEGLSHWMRRYNTIQNSVGWANLANNIIRTGAKRAVVCSSMAVYGSQQPPFDESMLPMPEDPYGAAKAAMEADVKSLGDVFGTEWTIIRPHNVFGPGQNLADPYRNVVAIFTRQALAGEPITVFGDGTQTRAFSYIDDVAPVIADAATDAWHSVTVNVGGEQPVPIVELARLVKDVSGTDSPIVNLPPRHEVADAFCDHQQLRRIYGNWRPVSLEAGYLAMFEWAKHIQIGPRRSYDYEIEERLYEPWRKQ